MAAGDEEGYDDNGDKRQVWGGKACCESNVWKGTNKDGKEEEGGVAMVVEIDGDDKKDDGDQKSEEVEDKHREELYATVSEWRDIMGTQELALEWVANLCSGSNDNEDDKNLDGVDNDDKGLTLTTTNTGPLHVMNVYSSKDEGGRKDKRREGGEGRRRAY
jgi:hypothetical protein